jgi:hypothetical protein
VKYRIISNGSEFRVQWRSWYWPFWICAKRYYPGGHAATIEIFRFIEDAQIFIKSEIADDNYIAKPWLPIDSSPEYKVAGNPSDSACATTREE